MKPQIIKESEKNKILERIRSLAKAIRQIGILILMSRILDQPLPLSLRICTWSRPKDSINFPINSGVTLLIYLILSLMALLHQEGLLALNSARGFKWRLP